MANVSGINGLSSLSEDLYYQYLINHNSTSTMLNALSGESDDSDASGLIGAVASGFGASGSNILSGLGNIASLSGLGGLFGDGGNTLAASQSLASFSSILETYLNAQRTEASQMADSLSSVLEEADEAGESSGLTYRTVQEIYDYFQEKASSGVSNALSSDASSSREVSAAASSAQQETVFREMDFDSLEESQLSEAERTVRISA